MNRTLPIVSAVALVVYLFATSWLGHLDRGGPPHTELVLEGGVPATLYLPEASSERSPFLDPPPPGERPAAVVMMHGFAGDRRSMSGLARRLAQSGYAALAIDARGHGENRNPYTRSWRGDAFFSDLSAAVDFLRTYPYVDGSRIAVMGHSMGAGASLDYATRDSGIDGAILISGGWTLDGPYRPPNALFIYASGDPAGIRGRSDELAGRLAGVEDVARSRTYGDLAKGTAVRVVEVRGASHQTIVWTRAAVEEIVAWLDAIFGAERKAGDVAGDPRFGAVLAVGLALLFLLPGLGALVGRLVPPGCERPAAAGGLGLLSLAAAFLLTMPLLAVGTPGTILSVEVGDVIVAHFALCGLVLLVVAFLREREQLVGLFRSPVPTLVGSAVGVIAVFVLMNPLGAVLHRVTLTPERTLVFVLATLGFLPLSLAFQLLLRRGSTLASTLYAVAGRALIALALVAGTQVGLLSEVVLFMLPAFILVFVFIEVLAASIYAASRNLGAISIIDAAWLALAVAAVMPIRI